MFIYRRRGCQAFITKEDKKLLLINKRNKIIQIKLPVEARDAQISLVDISTGENPPLKKQLTDDNITLNPFAVVVIKLEK